MIFRNILIYLNEKMGHINYQRHKAKEEDCREQSVCDHAARMAKEIMIVNRVEFRRIDIDI